MKTLFKYHCSVEVEVALSIVFICLNKSPLKIMENAFYFMLKVLFVLEIYTFLSWLFSSVEKRFNEKAKVNFKIYDVANWTTNNYNTYIVGYLKK